MRAVDIGIRHNNNLMIPKLRQVEFTGCFPTVDFKVSAITIRAFMYAGCPGIIMTLWVVEDKSGIKLMINFYKELVKGKPKDQALRIAKLKFIEEATLTKAHPFYWSSYICVGNVDPLFIPKAKIIIIIGAVIVSVAILIIIKEL